MERERQAPTGPCLTISLPQMLQVLCSEPGPLCARPQQLKAAAFSGGIVLDHWEPQRSRRAWS